jgi:multisubunit Na+/H+ antiporter MnhB subunit
VAPGPRAFHGITAPASSVIYTYVTAHRPFVTPPIPPPPGDAAQVDIWVLLISGLVISLLLSHFWNFTAVVGGQEHSVGLLGLAFLAGAVCSSTGVVFTPYLANRPKTYTSAHTGGAGLSGLVVAMLTLAADSGADRPRLAITGYFQVRGRRTCSSCVCAVCAACLLVEACNACVARDPPPVALLRGAASTHAVSDACRLDRP